MDDSEIPDLEVVGQVVRCPSGRPYYYAIYTDGESFLGKFIDGGRSAATLEEHLQHFQKVVRYLEGDV